MKLLRVSRSAKREWRVHEDEEQQLGRSLEAIELIGKFVGGSVRSSYEQGVWLFEWEDSEREGPRQWAVPIGDMELMAESYAAIDAITEFLGGAVVIGAIRPEPEPGAQWRTAARAFQWKSFLPSVKADPKPDIEPAPVPEPIAG